jgi:hypothetical protein
MLTMKLPSPGVLSALVSFSGAIAGAADWPNWRGPDYNGISKETIPAQLPEVLPVKWKAQVGIGFATVSVAGERVLTMGNRRTPSDPGPSAGRTDRREMA